MKRTGRSRLVAVALLTASAYAPRASADEGRPVVDAKSSEGLAAQAFELYKKGQYADAVALYLRAHEAAPSGVLLFNVARIYDQKLADRGQAAEYYGRALAAPDLDAELAKRARERVAALQAEAGRAPPGPAPAPATPAAAAGAPAPRESAGLPAIALVGWVATGALAAGAVVTGVIATKRSSDLEGESFALPPGGGAPDDFERRRDQAKNFALATDILAGAALAAGAASLYFTLAPRSEPSATALRLRVGPGFAGLGGAF
jgi:tetratricopeptide (TPR) repeat protein